MSPLTEMTRIVNQHSTRHHHRVPMGQLTCLHPRPVKPVNTHSALRFARRVTIL